MAEVPRHRQDRRTRATRLGALVSASAVMLSGVFVVTGPAGAAPPPGQDFNVTTGDLEFVLKQIQISEAHAEDVVTEDPDSSPLCRPGNRFDAATQTHVDADGDPCVGAPTLPFGLRTVDGRWNNLLPGQDGYGAGARTFPRLLEAQYRTADPVPAGFPGAGSPTTYEQTQGIVFDSEVRTISNLIVDQTTANPAAVDVAARVEGAGVINGATISRLAGPDRFATAAAISASRFGPGVPVAFIATGQNFPDALAGGPAAAAEGGPLLLVSGTGVPAATAAELLRLQPQNIVILGGTPTVNDAVADILTSYTAGTVTRLSGPNRFATAAAISAATFAPNVTRAYVTTGFNFPDALSASAPAARDGHPILLTNTGSVPAETAAELTRLAPQEIVVLGSSTSVSDATMAALGSYAPTVTRVSGADRYATSVAISAANYPTATTEVFLASGANYPDALAGGPVAGLAGGPLLLVPGTGALPAVVAEELQRLSPQRVTILGGLPTVSAAVEQQVAGLIAGTDIFIPDIATDEGLSASATSLFTIFGQFFDHGLDLVSKGGNGAVMVPLQPDDPLYVPGSPTNFFVLDRATIDSTDGGREHTNRTTPFIDQNQTYTSNPSHQVFLRDYDLVGGVPEFTGRLLNGADGGLATWADTKEQARTVFGIDLVDDDVLNVPLLMTDPYGRFVPGPNGFPQLAFEDGFVEGNPAAPISTTGALRANQAFLDDIAHGAVPQDPPAGYDNAALDAHFVTGDGRGNENIALTAVHHVFHAEHNRMSEQINDFLTTEAPPELLAGFQADGFWDYGERLFQAARFFTEMQYQHLVFEEFARRIQPNIDPTVQNENSYVPDLNPAISAEFAHVVYRFGHSMLTQTVDREFDGVVEEIPLLDAFLNPVAFRTGPNGETLTPDEAAGSVIQGMAQQTASGIDEFVVDTLRNELLGLPLDLPSINMLRARDTGVPPLQAARTTFFDATQAPELEPYSSWEDFRLSMKNPESILNFVAAYGIHPTLDGVTTIEGRRTAAEALVADPAFMTAPAAETGLNDVDFWMGGLAEKPFVFGGMLGTTFNFVFEQQLESLQNGDRFYYLNRNLGNTLFHTLEANSLSQIMLRNTEATALPHDVFADPQISFDLTDPAADLQAAGLTLLNGQWRFTGGEHIFIQGTDQADNVRGGIGDDSIWGLAGNDRIEGDDGVDAIMGGDGDDILTDLNGDDRIQGEAGNDVISGGPGLGDILFGGSGKDFIIGGQDKATSFAGLGDDFLLGSTGPDNLIGHENDDWIEGGLGHDLLVGDNSNTMMNDPNLSHGGHDVIIGGPGNNDHDAEGGDDIMVAGLGTERFGGMLGFDWVTNKGTGVPLNTDLALVFGIPQNLTAIRDRYLNVEAVSGWNGNDVIRGAQAAEPLDGATDGLGYGNRLTQEHLDRVAGLRDLLGGGEIPVYAQPFLVGQTELDTDFNNNILLGGQGSDLIEPRLGRNFVDGDAWVDVNVVHRPGGGDVVERQASINAYAVRMVNGTINPADLYTERRLQNDTTNQADAIDTVEFSGSELDYTIEQLEDNVWRVTNTVVGAARADVVRNVERLRFNDVTLCLPAGLGDPTDCTQENGSITVTSTFVEDEALTADLQLVDPASVVGPVLYELQIAQDVAQDGITDQWITTQANNTGSFTLGDAEVDWQVRVVASYTDTAGATQIVLSDPSPVFVQNVNDAPVAPTIIPAAPILGDFVRMATAPEDADGTTGLVAGTTGAWRFQRGAGDTWTDIAGATGTGLDPVPTYQVTAEDQGSALRLVVSYTDDLGTNENAASAATEVVPGG
ncbi:peroxidase family protein [Georgenia muralis]|uniref:Heme peroxidase n=1 Tax=Georgenia muralis TaxID=154117 RepID=A0A3N5A247_9MICO|nr:peroxidase family protein [Georgenia muralis]RPF25941.1 heme peroxidase [Georgenia muralis]